MEYQCSCFNCWPINVIYCFVQVLQSFKIMDYSLLLAIHKVEETSTNVVARYKRSNSEPATDKPTTRVETPSGHLSSPTDDTTLMTSGNGQWETRARSPGKYFMCCRCMVCFHQSLSRLYTKFVNQYVHVLFRR